MTRECPQCREPITAEQQMIICTNRPTHYYHRTCFAGWLRSNPHAPAVCHYDQTQLTDAVQEDLAAELEDLAVHSAPNSPVPEPIPDPVPEPVPAPPAFAPAPQPAFASVAFAPVPQPAFAPIQLLASPAPARAQPVPLEALQYSEEQLEFLAQHYGITPSQIPWQPRPSVPLTQEQLRHPDCLIKCVYCSGVRKQQKAVYWDTEHGPICKIHHRSIRLQFVRKQAEQDLTKGKEAKANARSLRTISKKQKEGIEMQLAAQHEYMKYKALLERYAQQREAASQGIQDVLNLSGF